MSDDAIEVGRAICAEESIGLVSAVPLDRHRETLRALRAALAALDERTAERDAAIARAEAAERSREGWRVEALARKRHRDEDLAALEEAVARALGEWRADSLEAAVQRVRDEARREAIGEAPSDPTE